MGERTIYMMADDAGKLFIGGPDVGWYDTGEFWNGVDDVDFNDVAQALLDGDTDSWTVERYEPHDQFTGNVVAEYLGEDRCKVYLDIVVHLWNKADAERPDALSALP